jgi:L,D-peptidoglycan transpeptidase YkuD (ErfK/YbiS/YcfS/YnhG family)
MQPMSERPERRRVTRALLALAALVLAGSLAVTVRPAAASFALAEETSGSADSSATTDVPLPLQLKGTGSATQLIVAKGRKLGVTTGTLEFWDYENGAWVCTMSVPCRFGKRGLMDGAHRWAGNKTTPTGIWRMPNYVFGYRKAAPSGTKMRFRHINGRSWWSSKRGRTYNTWVQARRWPGEYLFNVVPQYELAVSVGYNAKPNRVVYGRGTGIFLHVWGKGYTSGCVAISRANMYRVTRLLDPAKHPAFAVGTLATGTPTAIWSY